MKSFMQFIALIMLTCSLTSCAFSSHYIDNQYEPTTICEKIVGAENIQISINVNDERVQENVGYIGFGQEPKNFMIITNSNLPEIFKNAITSELELRGFLIADGGYNLDIEIYKFFNNFYVTGWVSGRGASETILQVVLKNTRGNILYSKTIYELG